jgi:hypothetical protein
VSADRRTRLASAEFTADWLPLKLSSEPSQDVMPEVKVRSVRDAVGTSIVEEPEIVPERVMVTCGVVNPLRTKA